MIIGLDFDEVHHLDSVNITFGKHLTSGNLLK